MYFMEGVQIYIGQCHNHLIVIAQVAVTSTVSAIPRLVSSHHLNINALLRLAGGEDGIFELL